MTEKCKETVYDRELRGISHRCIYTAKKDGYCGTHHPDAVKRRREKFEARFKKVTDEMDAKWERESFNRRAGDRCRELGIEPEDIKA